MTDQLALPLQRKRTPPAAFVCVDPEGIGRPWNGRGRRPDYVKRALRETGMYPVAKPEADTVSNSEMVRINARISALLELFTQHVRETTQRLEAIDRRLEALEMQEPLRRAA